MTLITGAREKTYHHSRYRDQAWARKVSPHPVIQVHPDDARSLNLSNTDWVGLETPGTETPCKLKVNITKQTDTGTVRTGMGWWLPEAEGPERAILEININVALSYEGTWDPVTGSADTRGVPCRINRLPRTEIPMKDTV